MPNYHAGRPAFLALVTSVLLLLSGCGAGGGTGRKGTAAGTVELTGGYGTVKVPVTASGVWALDPSVAVELLALGVVPTHVGRPLFPGDAANQAREKILKDAGVRLVEPGRIEPIVAAAPTLIVGARSPTTDKLNTKLAKVAPLLVTKSDAPWHETLTLLARATGRDARAKALIGRLNGEITATRGRVEKAGHGGDSVSLISACGSGTYCVYGDSRAAGAVLTGLGFVRPRGQDRPGGAWGYETVSEEKIADYGADIVFELTGSVQFGEKGPLDERLFDVSRSVTAKVDFSAWFGAGAFDVAWILRDLRATLLREGSIAKAEDGRALFAHLAGKGG